MATEKVGVYRRWLGPVPEENGKPVPKSDWLKKRRHSWTVRWYGTAGQRYSKDFKTRKEADKYARGLQTQVDRGKPDKPQKMVLHDFICEHAKVMLGRVAYATLYDQIRALRLFENYIGDSIYLRRILPSQAEGFVAARIASGVTIGTVNKDIRTLRHVFDLAIEPRGYLLEGQNPFLKIKERKKAEKPIRYISVEGYRALIDAASRLWWKGVISIAYCSGLRRSEILNLLWADVDFENQEIRVTAKQSTAQTIEWEPKDHENRAVPVSDETTKLLVDLQAEAEEGNAYLFVSRQRFKRISERVRAGRWNGKSEIVNNVMRDFEMICRRASIGKCTLHDLRRSALTNWARHLPIHVVQQLAGHSDIATTRKYYLSVQSSDIAFAKEAVNKILAARNHD
jgi:integrase